MDIEEMRRMLRDGAKTQPAPCCGEWGTGSGEHAEECPRRPKRPTIQEETVAKADVSVKMATTRLGFTEADPAKPGKMKHDKVYVVRMVSFVDETVVTDHATGVKWRVEAEWGRRGGTMKCELKSTHLSRFSAEKAYNKLIREKLDKGYTVEARS